MKYFCFLLTGLIFFSCKEEVGGDVGVKDTEIEVVDEGFQLTVTPIETLFDEGSFEFEESLDLLKELDICDTTNIIPRECSACSSKYFKFFKLNNNKEIRNSLLLQIRANTILKGTGGLTLPNRNLIAFERENNELVMVNGFRGNLIEKRSTPSGYDDLLIRFFIPSENAFFNCSFIWEDKKYRFKEVEAIDESGYGGAVKEEFRDSMSTIIYQVLKDNQMLF